MILKLYLLKPQKVMLRTKLKILDANSRCIFTKCKIIYLPAEKDTRVQIKMPAEYVQGLSLVLFWTTGSTFWELNEIALCERERTPFQNYTCRVLVRHTVISVDCSYVTHITQGI